MSTKINELLNKAENWEAAFNGDGFIDNENRVTIKEAFSTPDADFLFPKIISNVLREASEPELLVTPLLSTIRLTSGRSMEFPAINAIQAAEIPEGQEYPEQKLAFQTQVEGKVSKKGVKVSFTEEVIADSQWDIVGLHVRAAGRAMARLKEQIALSRFADAATVVFDNDGGTATTGLGADGAANESLTWLDIIDMAAILHAEGKVPTDFIAHPLMWAMFLKSAPNTHLAMGATQSLVSKSGTMNATAPFGINVILSPFVSFNAGVGGNPATSDVFLIDRNEIGSILVKDDLSVDEWTNQSRDLRSVKMKERYDIICYGDGEGIAVAKNVALAPNYDVFLTNEIGS